MGRKSNRDLWTAKLTGSPAQGVASGRQALRAVPLAGGVAGSAAGMAGNIASAASGNAANVAGNVASVASGNASGVVGNGTGVGAANVAGSRIVPAVESIRSEDIIRSTGKRAQRSTAAASLRAAAVLGTRAPFHGVVLGVDPSLRGTGIAVVRFSPPEQPRLLFSITVRNKPSLSPAQCLGNIARAVSEAIETYRPICVSLEQTVYVQNVKTSLILGSARGAAIAPAAMQGLEVFEYAPTRLKQAVVGHGKASKEQVAAMVRSLVQAGRDLLPSDEADAAAAAICHAFTTRG